MPVLRGGYSNLKAVAAFFQSASRKLFVSSYEKST